MIKYHKLYQDETCDMISYYEISPGDMLSISFTQLLVSYYTEHPRDAAIIRSTTLPTMRSNVSIYNTKTFRNTKDLCEYTALVIDTYQFDYDDESIEVKMYISKLNITGWFQVNYC